MENLNSFVNVDSSSSSLLCRSPSVEIDWTGFNPLPFGISSPDSNPSPVRTVEMHWFDSTSNMLLEGTSPPQPSPPHNKHVNIENDSSTLAPLLVSPHRDLSPAPERLVEKPRFDSIENIEIEKPYHVAMPPPQPPSPPRNEIMNIENGNVNPTSSFLISNLDSSLTPVRSVEMPRFVAIENPCVSIPPPPPPPPMSLPHNQTMNIENSFNPTPFFIPCLDPNPVRPVEMHPFNPTFENSWMAMLLSSSPPRNQTTNTKNHDFKSFNDEYKTKADIICENYMKVYRVDSSSIKTAVDRNFTAAFNNFSNFNDNNGLVFSSDSEMQYFPAASSLSSTEFSPPCDQVEAATHGGADSSAFKSKWSVEEHNLLLVGMKIFGRGDWTNIADKVVITKSNTQVSSHAQKYFLHHTLPRQTNGKKRASIHDITTVDPDLLSKVRDRLGLSPLPPPPSNE